MEMMDILLAKSMAVGESGAKAEELVNNHFVAGTNIVISDNPDGTQTISASGEVSAEDTVAREEIANHIADTNNPHSVTKSQLGLENVDNVKQVAGLSSGTTQNNLVTWGANGYTIADSGVAVETSISDSDAKVPTSKAIYTALGNKQDTIADLATIEAGAAAGATAVQPGDIGTAAAKNVDYFATAAQGGKADSAIQGVKVNNSAITPDSNKTVDITIDKTTVGLGNVDNSQQVRALATTPTENNLVTWGANGYTVKNSGKTISTTVVSTSTDNDIPTAKAVYTEVNKKQNKLTFDDAPTSGSSNPVKSSGIYTALSGKEDTIADLSDIRTGAGKGATAIQSVKVNGTALTPDANSAVDVTAVTGVKGNSESTYRTGEVNITKSNIGLGNVDNNKQVRALSTTPTENHIATWGANAYTVKDSGKSIVTTISSSSTDDGVPTAKAAYTELAKKQDTLTFDGTYDASTNKAATKSTVTNAINALDVTGASGISASKTISAWNETNGKVSISTQDITITGTQTVLTRYQKSTTAGQAVAATDTVNGAIGKIEKRVSDNESNISSLDVEVDTVANLGAKNFLDFNQWASKIAVYNGTKSYSNGVMTVTATGSSCVTYHNQYFPEGLKIPVKEGEKYTITWDTTVTTNIGFFQLCPNGNAISGTDVSIADKQTEYTVTSGVTYLTYRVGVWASGNSINISKLMLRPATISDSTYQPYAMSNAELTAKEQQNENNITINANYGVKNRAASATIVSPSPDITVVQDGEGHYEISGDSGGVQRTIRIYDPSTPLECTEEMFVAPANTSENTTYACYWTLNDNDSYTTIPAQGLTIPIGAKINRLYIQVQANKIFDFVVNLMVCPKSLYDADPSHQPYAMSNAELTAKEQQNENNISSLAAELHALLPNITASTTIQDYANSLSKGVYTAFIANTSNPSDSPINANCFVNIYVYSSTTAAVELIPMSAAENARTYTMRKIVGTWRKWCVVEGTPVASSTQS